MPWFLDQACTPGKARREGRKAIKQFEEGPRDVPGYRGHGELRTACISCNYIPRIEIQREDGFISVFGTRFRRNPTPRRDIGIEERQESDFSGMRCDGIKIGIFTRTKRERYSNMYSNGIPGQLVIKTISMTQSY